MPEISRIYLDFRFPGFIFELLQNIEYFSISQQIPQNSWNSEFLRIIPRIHDYYIIIISLYTSYSSGS